MRKLIFFMAAVVLLASCAGKADPKQPTEKQKPATKTEQGKEVAPATIYSVYIENSGSMDGYIEGATEFKTAIYNYLVDIKNYMTSTDSLHIAYINKCIYNQKPDVEDFFGKKLTVDGFRAKINGERGTTDVCDVIKLVLDSMKKDEIAMLITDAILSPGKGKNADQYLANQEAGVKDAFNTYKKEHPDIAVIVYKLESKFNGKYFDKKDDSIPVRGCVRPFYVFLFGAKEQLALLEKQNPPAKRLQGHSYGKRMEVFRVCSGCEKKTMRKIGSAIDVNFDNFFLGNEYVENLGNYECSGGKQGGNDNKYKIQEITECHIGGYTHRLAFDKKQKNLPELIKLKSELPGWIEESNEEVGGNPIEGKTYGIKKILKGIYEAFRMDEPYYVELNS